MHDAVLDFVKVVAAWVVCRGVACIEHMYVVIHFSYVKEIKI